MVRATHGVHRGAYYYEILVLPPLSDNAHVRVGWSTRRGELQAPVGYDEFSYGYRDIDGTIIHSMPLTHLVILYFSLNHQTGSQVHRSLRVDHYGESYRDGDVIGCYLKLVEEVSMNEIRFFKNGIDQGVAYSGEEIPSSVYFPAISLYMKVGPFLTHWSCNKNYIRNICFLGKNSS